jgi:hypothetical protein
MGWIGVPARVLNGEWMVPIGRYIISSTFISK